MKRIGVVGDIHGRTGWKDITREIDRLDRIVFIGDYMDSFIYSHRDCFANMQEVLQFKLEYPEKVTLLMGNHDVSYAYINIGSFRCPGFHNGIASEIHAFFQEHGRHFRYLHYEERVCFTHAGLDLRFYEVLADKYRLPDFDAFVVFMAGMSADKPVPQEFSWCGRSRGGERAFGSILWADCYTDTIHYHPAPQIVGHSPVGHSPHRRNTLVRNPPSTVFNVDTGDNGRWSDYGGKPKHWHIFEINNSKIDKLG